MGVVCETTLDYTVLSRRTVCVGEASGNLLCEEGENLRAQLLLIGHQEFQVIAAVPLRYGCHTTAPHTHTHTHTHTLTYESIGAHEAPKLGARMERPPLPQAECGGGGGRV